MTRVYRGGSVGPQALLLKCNRHFNADSELECTRELTVRDMSLGEAKRRLKRWFLAGLDDSDWPAEARRYYHGELGGFVLRDFADEKGGMSEEEMDRLISES